MKRTFQGLGLGPVAGLIILCALYGMAVAGPTITGFADRTIVQRASGEGQFDASGTYTGTPAGIEVRAVDSTGKEVRTWKDAALVAAKKQWRVTLDHVPEGGWYHLQARDKGAPATQVQSKTRFGVGIIILLMGQSNMAGFCNTPAKARQTLDTHPLTAHARMPNFEWWIPPAVKNHGVASVLLANNVAEVLQIPVGVLRCAKSSTNLREWLGEFYKPVRGKLPDTLKTALRKAGGDIEMVIWYQGFADFSAATAGATVVPDSIKNFVWNNGWDEFEEKVKDGSMADLPYKLNLNKLHKQISNQIRRDNPIFLCGIKGRSFASKHIENMEVWNTINKSPWDWSLAQSNQVNCTRWSYKSFAKDHPHGGLAGNAIDLRMNESAHNIGPERFILASRYSQSVLHTVGAAAYSGRGPSFVPEKTSLKDGKILLIVKHEGGDSLLIPFTGQPIEGFIVRESGKKDKLPIKKVTIRQPDSVLIELNQPATADLLVGYLTGPSPISDYKGSKDRPIEVAMVAPPGNIIYDNAKLPAGNNRPGLMVNGTLGLMRVRAEPGQPEVTLTNFEIPAGLRFSLSADGFRYTLGEAGRVSLRVYDSGGRLIEELFNGLQPAGMHRCAVRTSSMAPGVYFVRLSVEGKRAGQLTRKMVLF